MRAVEPSQSALIVVVPEAEPVVGPHRAALDPAAAWGVPAHVTVLFPFLPPGELTGGTLTAVRDVVATVPAFDVTFGRVRWFGDTTVWLDPAPAEPFQHLTRAVWDRFPQAPPYGGEYGDGVTPHLTVGHQAPRDALQAAADAVAGGLPLRARVEEVRLVVGSPVPGSWRTLTTFALGAPGSTTA